MIDPMDLQGRTYIEGWQDCYSLAQEYYVNAFGLTLRDYARPKGWELLPELNFFETLFEREGFIEPTANIRDVRIGDALLMALGQTPCSNHIAIYVGGGNILHHLFQQHSRVEPYSDRWRFRVRKVLRYRHADLFQEGVTLDDLAQAPRSMRHKMMEGSHE